MNKNEFAELLHEIEEFAERVAKTPEATIIGPSFKLEDETRPGGFLPVYVAWEDGELRILSHEEAMDVTLFDMTYIDEITPETRNLLEEAVKDELIEYIENGVV